MLAIFQIISNYSKTHLKLFLIFILDGAQQTLLLRYDLLAVNQLSLLLNDLMPGALQQRCLLFQTVPQFCKQTD